MTSVSPPADQPAGSAAQVTAAADSGRLKWLVRLWQASDLATRAYFLSLVLLVVIAVATRLRYNTSGNFPLDNDAMYYRGLGVQLAEGHDGFGRVSLVWQYLSNPTQLPTAAHDYWMPLPSLAVALSVALFGPGRPEIYPAALFGGLLALITALVSTWLSGSRWLGLLAGLSLCFLDYAIYTSIDGDSPPIAAAFGVAGLALVSAATSERRILAAGVLCGLAHLSRGDGSLAMGAAVLWLGFAALKARSRASVRNLLALLLGYGAVLAPFCVRNLFVFHTLLPPGSTRALWLTGYEQLYSMTAELTPAKFFAPSFGAVLDRWESSLRGTLGWIVATAHLPLMALAAVGLIAGRNKRQQGPFLVHAALVLGFYSTLGAVLAPVGALVRGSIALFPIGLALAATGAEALLSAARNAGGGRIRLARNSVVVAGLGALMLYPSWDFLKNDWARRRSEHLRGMAASKQRYDQVCGWMSANAPSAIVMSASPWPVWYRCHLPSVMAPTDGVASITKAVERFHVTHLVLRDADVSLAGHAPLRTLLASGTGVPGARLVGTVNEFKVYAIETRN